ncbi:CoA transferase, partial [Chloroflexota bacterium]
PYRDYQSADIVNYAMGGFSNLSGRFDREPLQHVIDQDQFMGARSALVATMSALFYQRATGAGQYIDVSITETIATQPPLQISRYTYTGGIETRAPKRTGTLDGGFLQCKDGNWALISTGAGFFELFAELLDLPELLDPKFADTHSRNVYAKELEDLVLPKIKQSDMHDIFHKGEKQGMAIGMVQNPPEILNCPQLNARNFFKELEHPEAGKLTYPEGCAMMSETPAELKNAAPLLGSHNKEIYCGQLKYTTEDLVKLREQGII